MQQLAPGHAQTRASTTALLDDDQQVDPLANIAAGGDGDDALHLLPHARHAPLHSMSQPVMVGSPVADPYHLTDPDPRLDVAQPADRV